MGTTADALTGGVTARQAVERTAAALGGTHRGGLRQAMPVLAGRHRTPTGRGFLLLALAVVSATSPWAAGPSPSSSGRLVAPSTSIAARDTADDPAAAQPTLAGVTNQLAVAGSRVAHADRSAAAHEAPRIVTRVARRTLSTPRNGSSAPGAVADAPRVRPALALAVAALPARDDLGSLGLTARYHVVAEIDWNAGAIRVDTELAVTNSSPAPAARLELNTLAATLGSMQLLAATVDGRAVEPVVDGQNVLVPLADPLAVGATARVRIVYSASFRHSMKGTDYMWAQVGDVLSLYRFIPWLTRVTPFEPNGPGESFVTPSSPEVAVTLRASRPLTYATSGRLVTEDLSSRTFLAHNVRDFNLTASPSYRVLDGTSVDGETAISVYTRWGHGPEILAQARRALAAYERWIGPYPYPTLTLAQTAGGPSKESPAHVWISRTFTPTSTLHPLDYAVVHEIAHEWFYAVAGNDQFRDPFADEAVADLLSRTLAWHFRATRCPMQRLDLAVDGYSAACYSEVIYVQGSNFLNGLRHDLGAARFWQVLRRYYADSTFRISSTNELLRDFLEVGGDSLLPKIRAAFPSFS